MWTSALAGALVLAASLLGLACREQPPPSALARIRAVEAASGTVEFEHQGRWAPARPGQSLLAGDAVRTGPGARADLVFDGGREVRLAERSLIRLGLDAASSVHVTLELGRADIEGEGALTVTTARGPARLADGTRMRVQVDGAHTRYEVSVGRAVIGQGADQLVLGSGEGVSLTIGSAEIERYRIEVGAAELEPAPPVATNAAGTADAEAVAGAARTGEDTGGVRRPGERVPAAFDVTVPVGESAVLHGRQPPLVIRLQLDPPCPPGGRVSLVAAGGRPRLRAEGREHALLSVPSGVWSYRYQCEQRDLGRGTLTVRRDGGTQHLPRVAPTNVIDADGRRYTVLYQNRLPSLTFTWPDAPATGSYTLHVEGKHRLRQYPVGRPELRLASGALPEGTYQWWFDAGGGRSSKRTTVTVRFDNAAVTAQVDSPRDGIRVAPGSEIDVAGVAIEGSTVAVGSAPLQMDEQGRFRGKAAALRTHERSVAIRLAHPKSGVHYYVRRIAQ